jgi:hypothetical protein
MTIALLLFSTNGGIAMNNVWLILLVFFLASNALFAQQQSSNSVNPNKNATVKTSPDARQIQVDSGEINPWKSVPDSLKVTPMYRYVDRSQEAVINNRVFPSDTIITPTMRYYPGRKKQDVPNPDR